MHRSMSMKLRRQRRERGQAGAKWRRNRGTAGSWFGFGRCRVDNSELEPVTKHKL